MNANSTMCVLPAYRHKGIGKVLLNHAFRIAEESGCKKMNIGIVEENLVQVQSGRLHWQRNIVALEIVRSI